MRGNVGGWNSLQWVGHAERTCDRDERQALGPSDRARDGDENRTRARGANKRTRETKERGKEKMRRENGTAVLPVECDERYSNAVRVLIRER